MPTQVQPITAVIVGAGHRAMNYASYALKHPEELKIVAVADPDPVRRARAAERFAIPAERQFETAEQLAALPRFADAAINGTMDRQHVPTSLPLLAAGYHLLLEKPFAVAEEELWQLVEAAHAHDRTVMICHVLRYAPFYAEIRRRVAEGQLGRIVAIRTSELVSYHHMGTAFVRGKWGRREVAPMLLAKCCHDLDLLCWLKSGIQPTRVSSNGGLMHFRPEMAPEGAGVRCLTDCAIEADCPYSAKRLYVDANLWGPYAWHCLEHLGPNPTTEQKLESLRTDNPYGRCVWRAGNDVVDHQGVLVEFEDGSMANHSLIGGTAKPCRQIHIIGTLGEIEGVMEEGVFVVRRPDPTAGDGYQEERVELSVSAEMHGGGDHRLVTDFLRVLRGQEPSLSTTYLADSIAGHLIAFAADHAMRRHTVVPLPDIADPEPMESAST